MAESRFLHVTFIRATPRQVWDALTGPEFARRYWAGVSQVSEGRANATGRSFDACAWEFGRIVESDEPRRLVLTWHNGHLPDAPGAGSTRLSFAIECLQDGVKLTVTQEIAGEHPSIAAALGHAWPDALTDLGRRVEMCACLSFLAQTAERISA